MVQIFDTGPELLGIVFGPIRPATTSASHEFCASLVQVSWRPDALQLSKAQDPCGEEQPFTGFARQRQTGTILFVKAL